jgi:hypothetical protein
MEKQNHKKKTQHGTTANAGSGLGEGRNPEGLRKKGAYKSKRQPLQERLPS